MGRFAADDRFSAPQALLAPAVTPIATAVVDMLYPPACTLCGIGFYEKTATCLCESCIEALRGSRRSWCQKCGKPVDGLKAGAESCSACRSAKFPFQHVSILGAYDGAMREAVIAGKKYINEPLVRSLGLLLGQLLRDRELPTLDSVTYVPSHWRRRLSRGTTPAATIAKFVGKVLNCPVSHDLKCIRHTAKQAMMPSDQRQANVKGAFAVRKHQVRQGSRILVVDDVMTSGATLAEVSKILRREGAKHVLVAAAARGLGKT